MSKDRAVLSKPINPAIMGAGVKIAFCADRCVSRGTFFHFDQTNHKHMSTPILLLLLAAVIVLVIGLAKKVIKFVILAIILFAALAGWYYYIGPMLGMM